MINPLLFWILAGLLFYLYIGYGMLMGLLALPARKKAAPPLPDDNALPHVTLFVAAYNEKDWVEMKIANSRALNYPREKLHLIWVTDGSDDGTPQLVASHTDIQLLHQAERQGKIGAMNRGMAHVTTPITVFSDANTLLSQNAIRALVAQFSDPHTGCVTGEKRIVPDVRETASVAGEGIYWRYESWLKKNDSAIHSTVGAVGELFAIRTSLFQPLEPDTLLDDFMISMRIALQGYTIKYAPDAIASETASLDIKEEFKRKTRIAAGSLQATLRLGTLLNPFRYPLFSFQYISHKLLRWFVPPPGFVTLFVLNVLLAAPYFRHGQGLLYVILLAAQLLFYVAAAAGWYAENRKTRIRLLFVPCYIVMINLAVVWGVVRFLRKKQTVNWQRAQRGTLQ